MSATPTPGQGVGCPIVLAAVLLGLLVVIAVVAQVVIAVVS